jgi:hypothetical protein
MNDTNDGFAGFIILNILLIGYVFMNETTMSET